MTVAKKDVVAGAKFEVVYPYTDDNHGSGNRTWWRPGATEVARDEYVADAEGRMRLEVISTHKPGKYQLRVFFLRIWIDPDGVETRDGNLHTQTITWFLKRAEGYEYDYAIDPDAP